ncbi:MAG: hypothetical protein M3R17_15255 [Bacteroidota bacterium]|nr:hypothetical protein [Bacteroidota bacterium]
MDVLNHPVLRQTGPLRINIADSSACYYCKTGPLGNEIIYCPSCGFPQRGTEEEQKKFITAKRLLVIKLEGMHDNIKKSRNALFGVAALYGVSYIILALQIGWPAIIEGSILCGIFIGLGLWANKNPYPAVLTGLILFILFIIISAIGNPVSIIGGIIWKIIILTAMIYGLKAAKDAKDVTADLEAAQVNLS